MEKIKINLTFEGLNQWYYAFEDENSRYSVQLHTTDKIPVELKNTKETTVGNTVYFIRQYAKNVIVFGCYVDGVWWSSNSSEINKAFGTKYIEVVIDHACYAMDIDDLAEILPEGYEIRRDKNDEYYYYVMPVVKK